MEMTIEIDEQKVIDNLDDEEIFKMSTMNASSCKKHFGNDLLDEFTLAEIIEHCGRGEISNEIGEKEVIEHFGIDVAE